MREVWGSSRTTGTTYVFNLRCRQAELISSTLHLVTIKGHIAQQVLFIAEKHLLKERIRQIHSSGQNTTRARSLLIYNYLEKVLAFTPNAQLAQHIESKKQSWVGRKQEQITKPDTGTLEHKRL